MNREKFSSMVEKKSAVKPVAKVVENAKGEPAEEVVVEEQLSDNEWYKSLIVSVYRLLLYDYK